MRNYSYYTHVFDKQQTKEAIEMGTLAKGWVKFGDITDDQIDNVKIVLAENEKYLSEKEVIEFIGGKPVFAFNNIKSIFIKKRFKNGNANCITDIFSENKKAIKIMSYHDCYFNGYKLIVDISVIREESYKINNIHKVDASLLDNVDDKIKEYWSTYYVLDSDVLHIKGHVLDIFLASEKRNKKEKKEKQSEQAPFSNNIKTTTEYWDCDCETGYIKSKDQKKCDDCADSRVDEVEKHVCDFEENNIGLKQPDPVPVFDDEKVLELSDKISKVYIKNNTEHVKALRKSLNDKKNNIYINSNR